MDANGNMLSGAGRSVTYTSFNLTATLAQGSANIAFAYDSEHARIVQTSSVTGTTTYLDDPTSGAMEEQVASGGIATWNDYIRMPGTEPEAGALLALRTSDGGANWGAANWSAFDWSGGAALLYYTLDSLGSIAVIADASGSVTERDSYDAWGRRRNANGTDIAGCAFPASATTRGYTGQEMMDAVCAVNLNARIYDPTIARFLAADPVTQNEYDLQTLNRYSWTRRVQCNSCVIATGKAWFVPEKNRCSCVSHQLESQRYQRFQLFPEQSGLAPPKTENPRVGGSIPPLGTIRHCVAQARAFNPCPFGPDSRRQSAAIARNPAKLNRPNIHNIGT